MSRIVAIGLLTQRDVEALGHSFTRLWPVEDTPCFDGLLRAIDEADRAHWRARDHIPLQGGEDIAD
jgi:hypothetical protein